MAFGAVLSTGTRGAASITNPFAVTAGFSVNIGDLVVVGISERANLTATAISDGLAGSYSELNNPGVDAGNGTLRAWYKIITAAGTCTPSVTTTASGDDAAIAAVRFEGPFANPPLDRDPTPVSNDTATPYTGPASGALAQADQLIVSIFSYSLSQTMSASSPNTLAVTINSAAPATANSCGIAIGSQVVASVSSVSPAWTGTAPVSDVIITASFRKATNVTTFNPNDKGANIALTGGNLIATKNTADAFQSVRSTNGKLLTSGGKWHFEITVGSEATFASIAIGVANELHVVGSSYISDASGNSVGCWSDASGAYVNIADVEVGSNDGPPTTSMFTGQTIVVEVDLDNDRIWFGLPTGNWNNNGSANPATNTGGHDISGVFTGSETDCYIGVSLFDGTGTPDAVTLNAGATPFARAISSGFSAWDPQLTAVFNHFADMQVGMRQVNMLGYNR